MDPGAQKLSLGLRFSLSSVLLPIEFILRQEGCRIVRLSPLPETPVETMSRFNNSHKSFGVESFIDSDDLPLLDPWL